MAKVQDGLFAYLRAQGWDTTEEMCISYVCFEGTTANVEREKAIVKKIVARNGGITLGAGPGAVYDRKQFDTPYLRDFLMNLQVFVDVCETVENWSDIKEVISTV